MGWLERWIEQTITAPDDVHDRRMFRLGLVGAGIGALSALWCGVAVDDPWLQAPLLSINLSCIGLNSFMAGKWARRIEARQEPRLWGDW